MTRKAQARPGPATGLLAALALAAIGWPGAAASAPPRDQPIVTGQGKVLRIGPLARSGGDLRLADARAAFGAPSFIRGVRGDDPGSNAEEDQCQIRWASRGVRAVSGAGHSGKRICAGDKRLVSLTIRSTRFQTQRGLRVGATKATVRRLYPGAGFVREDDGQEEAGIYLGESDGLYAELRGGRIDSFFIAFG